MTISEAHALASAYYATYGIKPTVAYFSELVRVNLGFFGVL